MASRGAPKPDVVLWCFTGLGLAAAGASVLNNYFDEDIDRLMQRTSSRPLPSRRVSRGGAIAFGTMLSTAAFWVLLLLVNLLSALLAAAAMFFYAFLYTAVLKRKTPLAAEIGGIAGALPPVIGWVAAKGEIGLTAWMLFAIMFFWQPPHFWSLASVYREEYRTAGIPAIPAVRGNKETKYRSGLYIAALIIASLLPYYAGAANKFYLFSSLVLGFVYLSLNMISLVRMGTVPIAPRQVFDSTGSPIRSLPRAMMRGLRFTSSVNRDSPLIGDAFMFRFSIIYLAFIFISLVADINLV